MRTVLLRIFALWVFVGDSTEENLQRPRRVVNGFTLVDRQKHHYKAMEYFVWIGETWSCADEVAWYVRWGFATPDSPGSHYACLEKPHREVCGGALISPRIVQTACHCLSQAIIYDKRVLWTGRLLDPGLKERYQIYMGFTHLHDMVYPVPSEHVHIHQLCAKLSYIPKYGRYDFGWITLKHTVDWGRGVVSGTWGTKLDYAGPYLREELDRQYNRVLGNMHVCMTMGYGDAGLRHGPPWEELTHGYIQILDWYSCYYWLTESFHPMLDRVRDAFVRRYNASQSWVCAKKISKFKQYSGHGDSGGPISCNGQYFSIVSQYQELGPGKRILGAHLIMLDMAIKFAPEANTVEFRKRFEDDTLKPLKPSTTPPNQAQWWTNREGLRRLGQGAGQVVGNPEKHLGNSRTHSNSNIQRYYNRAIRSRVATQLYFISVASIVRT